MDFKGGSPFDIYNVELRYLDENVRLQMIEVDLAFKSFRKGKTSLMNFIIEIEDLIDRLIATGRWEIIEIEKLNNQTAQLQNNGTDSKKTIQTSRAFKQELYLDMSKKQIVNRDFSNIYGDDSDV